MDDGLDPFSAPVAEALQSGEVRSKEDLHRLKQRIARAARTAIPRDSDLIRILPDDLVKQHLSILRKKPMRTGSGVAVLAVMSSPAACPHGKCVYCPGGPEVDAPQSYTGFEPSTMRAKRFGYDPFRIARARLGQLQRNGHAVAKVDVVIQGGTFPARDQAYRDWFVAGIYAGCNAGPDVDAEEGWVPFEVWKTWEPQTWDATLRSVMLQNEEAQCRVIGLTIETKPDWCLQEHIDDMLRYGCTRIELGIQTLDEATTQFTNRGHTVQDAADAMRIARDAGFKVCVHMMPGLPRPKGEWRTRQTAAVEDGSTMPGLPRPKGAGSPGMAAGAEGNSSPTMPGLPRPKSDGSIMAGPARSKSETGRTAAAEGGRSQGDLDPDPAMDREDMRRLFAEPEWRPDMLKIYPTLVVMEGETSLKRWWQEGRYQPYDTDQAAAVVADAYRHIPAYCRVQRVDRDIPTTHVDAGVQNSNLRQIAEAKAVADGVRIRDVRAREVHRKESDPDGFQLIRREYEAGGGTEVFLSWEEPEHDAIAGFVRLRRVGTEPHRDEFQHPDGCAVVRELKVVGTARSIGDHDDADGAFQHKGLGARLLAEAERVAFDEWHVGRLLVIAGVGVKPYYRDRGFMDMGPYVAKEQS